MNLYLLAATGTKCRYATKHSIIWTNSIIDNVNVMVLDRQLWIFMSLKSPEEWAITKQACRDKRVIFFSAFQYVFNNYSLKSRWIVAKYHQNHLSPRLKRIVALVYTHEVISTKSERKPLKGTIWLTDQITRKFKNRSLQNFQTWQFTSLSLRKQQRNGSNETIKSLNCFLTWEEK